MSFFRKSLRKGKNLAKKEENDVKEIWRRIKERDFSGNTGLAVKNSIYQFSTNISAKIGSFIFTVIIARLLMPELFGLYSLALSTIIIFGSVSELGIGTTLVRFISKERSKKRGKIKSYLSYFVKIKIFLVLLSSLILLLSARYIANNLYQKPIFLALLAGALYIIFFQIFGFLRSIVVSFDNFKPIFRREIIFQISRVILVPLAVVFAIKESLSDEVSLMIIMIFLAISFFITSVFLFFDMKKTYRENVRNEKPKKLSKKQKKTVNKFLLATAVLVLSGAFFGNIDRVMLGAFVPGEFIGFYTAAFSIIGALAPIVGFSSIVLLPIFSRLKGKRLERGFKKSVRMTLPISLGAFAAALIFAYLAILIVYGREYLLSVGILRFLSPLLLALPIIGIYTTYIVSQGNPRDVAKILVITVILNIILNYILITSFLPQGNLKAVYGAALATLISQFAYLGGLVWLRKKYS